MASFTINTSPAEDARIVVSFGTYLGLGRNATAAEVKAAVAAFIINVVKNEEASALARTVPASIAPT